MHNAHKIYPPLPVKAESCNECGECEPKCPYNLPLIRMPKDASKPFPDRSIETSLKWLKCTLCYMGIRSVRRLCLYTEKGYKDPSGKRS